MIVMEVRILPRFREFYRVTRGEHIEGAFAGDLLLGLPHCNKGRGESPRIWPDREELIEIPSIFSVRGHRSMMEATHG